MNSVVKLAISDINAIPYQEASLDIWDKKYRLTSKDGEPLDRSMDDTYKRVARALADVEDARRSRALVRALSLGAAPRRDSGRTRDVQCRRAGAQAGHLDHQLHGLGHGPRFDGRHPRQGARGGTDTQGRLRYRLRILDAAAARRLRVRRRLLYLRSAVVHGYLRPDVLHGVLGRRSSRRADGHVRCRTSGCDGFRARQARERPSAAVQSVAADHRRVHAGGEGGSRVEAGVPGRPARGRGRRAGSEGSRRNSSGASGRRTMATWPTRRDWSPAASTARCRRVASGTSSCPRPTISPSRVSS